MVRHHDDRGHRPQLPATRPDHIVLKWPAPSMRAASKSLLGHVAKAGKIEHHSEAGEAQPETIASV